jgi:hypothetical protein
VEDTDKDKSMAHSTDTSLEVHKEQSLRLKEHHFQVVVVAAVVAAKAVVIDHVYSYSYRA